MPVIFETGDLFSTPHIHAFAHGCNCAGAMGKGIAVAFRQRWPAMYEEYRKRCKSGSFELGDVFVWKAGDDVVFNLGTQRTWKDKAELWAVERALDGMLKIAEESGLAEVAMPRIGAGLGGLDWIAVRSLLEKLGSSTSVRLRVCETFVAGQPLASAE
jgi:O-acetyl-ADP-ribose deacetylase (regulator of RNase III)